MWLSGPLVWIRKGSQAPNTERNENKICMMIPHSPPLVFKSHLYYKHAHHVKANVQALTSSLLICSLQRTR